MIIRPCCKITKKQTLIFHRIYYNPRGFIQLGTQILSFLTLCEKKQLHLKLQNLLLIGVLLITLSTLDNDGNLPPSILFTYGFILPMYIAFNRYRYTISEIILSIYTYKYNYIYIFIYGKNLFFYDK
jgi:hypothetical protein